MAHGATISIYLLQDIRLIFEVIVIPLVFSLLWICLTVSWFHRSPPSACRLIRPHASAEGVIRLFCRHCDATPTTSSQNIFVITLADIILILFPLSPYLLHILHSLDLSVRHFVNTIQPMALFYAHVEIYHGFRMHCRCASYSVVSRW